MTRVSGLARLLGAAAVGAALIAGSAFAQDKGEVRVHIGGGDWADANFESYVEPFEKETGIKVIAVRDWTNLAMLKLMIENDNVEIDVGGMPYIDYLTAAKSGWLEKIDYSVFDAKTLDGLSDRDKLEYGAGYIYAAYVLAYNTEALPEGKRPASWAEFWDVEKFPGSRTMRVGVYGSGPWEEALIADGVPMDQLYPLNIDRVFASLDKIKPHITKWWKEGAEGQQVFADGIADMGHVFNGRIGNLQKLGMPIAIEWNQAKMQVDYLVVPKGAKNRENAMKYVAFALRADRQGQFSTKIPYGPSNTHAYEHMPEDVAKNLPTHPDNAKRMFVMNGDWYKEERPDGKTNQEYLIERWNTWILE
ncbi:MAG: ABC transporter substrate-binding protein [Proteobacteria bacterium]|nr:ABC transporter substrate-binding protein [Pseudomonadota bacterium]